MRWMSPSSSSASAKRPRTSRHSIRTSSSKRCSSNDSPPDVTPHRAVIGDCARAPSVGIIPRVVDVPADIARPRNGFPMRCRAAWVLIAMVLTAFSLAVNVDAQNKDNKESDDKAEQKPPREIPLNGDRLSGIVLPIEPLNTDINLSALRATAWTVDDTKR